MMIPGFKRIWKTDFKPEFQEMIDKLSYSINIFAENITTALTNRLSLKDNIQCTLKTFNITVDSNGKPKTPLTFTLTSSGSLTGIVVLSAINQTNQLVFPTSTPFINYSINSTSVSIVNVTGLPADNNFLITLVAFTN